MDIFDENGVTVRPVRILLNDDWTEEVIPAESFDDDSAFYGVYVEDDEGFPMWEHDFITEEAALAYAERLARRRTKP